MIITQKLQKWGNGTGVRLPQKVVKAARLQINQPLEVTLRGRSIVLTPILTNEQSLDDLLRDVTPGLVAGELGWGEDVGAEHYE